MAVTLIIEDESQFVLLPNPTFKNADTSPFSAGPVAEATAILDRPDHIDMLFTDIGLRDDLQARLELAKVAVERRRSQNPSPDKP